MGELKKLLPEGGFAARLAMSLGRELHDRLTIHSSFGSGNAELDRAYLALLPVESLYLWVSKNGGLDPEWMEGDDGVYYDDQGNPMPESVTPTYSGVEQLAAYGLWLARTLFYSRGEGDKDQEHNEQGWSHDEVAEHRAECLLLAYQALAYAQKLIIGAPLTEEEKARLARADFSKLGAAGAKKRHGPMNELRVWAVQQYKARTWASANQAAHELMRAVVDHGRTIGATLSEQNAQRTIAEWFRKSA